MPASERRFWWCKKGHIMGEIKTVAVSGGRVRALMLYETSIALQDVPDDLPPLRARIIGSAEQIKCTFPGCDHTRDWIIGEDGMRQLLASVKRMHQNIEN